MLPTGTVTFLFTDIEGSTKLLQQLGSRYPAVLDEHAAVIRAALEEHAGVEVSTEGDAFFCVFPGAPDALRAALVIQRGLASQEWPDGTTVRIRMGLHTGEGILGGDNYSGLDVNRAARIASAGHGGQVLISEATRGLVVDTLSEDVQVRDLGEQRLKDLDRPERIHQLVIDGLESEFPPLRTLDPVQHNLPVQLTSFLGREDEVATVRAAIGASRLVTLTGPGGTGKTRLGIEAAAAARSSLPDGAWFVGLAQVDDPDLLPAAIVDALGLRYPVGTARDQVAQHFERRDALLLLDNFEQLLPGAPIVVEWLRECPNLRVLVTSRAPLRVSGEQEIPVPPLPSPVSGHVTSSELLTDYPAVQLFVDRARAAKPGFELAETDAAVVAEITERLDGLPLALELAAALVKLLPPKAILDRLSSSLDLLTGGPQDLPERQRSLRDAMAWSYELLDDRARLLLEHLAVFAGGASYEKIEEVCAPDDPAFVLDALRTLVDQSLITQGEIDGEPRFDMLSAIREFALERLHDRKHADEVRARHAQAFRALVLEAEEGLRGPDEGVWNVVITRELDNIRAAFQWALERVDVDMAYDISVGLARWALFRAREDVSGWTLRARELPGASEHPMYARASAAMAWAVSLLGEVDSAQTFVEEGLAAEASDDVALFDLYEAMISIRMFKGDAQGSLSYVRLAEDLDLHTWDRAYLMLGQCLVLAYTGDPADAYERALEFEAIAREVGNPTLIAYSAYAQGESLMQTDPQAALGRYEESIRIGSSVEARFLVGVAQVSLASLRARHGEPLEALATFRDLVDLWHRAEHWTQLWTTLRNVAEAFARLRAFETAAVLYAAIMETRSGARIFGEDAIRLAELSRRLDAELGVEERARHESRGRSLTPDEVVAVVLAEMDRLLDEGN